MTVFRGRLCVPYMLNLMVNISFIYVKSSQLRKWDLLSWCILWGYKREYTEGFTTIECIQINLVVFLYVITQNSMWAKLLNVKLSNVILGGQVKYGNTPYWYIASRLLRVQLVRNVQIFEISFPLGWKPFVDGNEIYDCISARENLVVSWIQCKFLRRYVIENYRLN